MIPSPRHPTEAVLHFVGSQMSTAQKGKHIESHATNVENKAMLFSKAQKMRRKKIQHFGYNHSAPFLRDLSLQDTSYSKGINNMPAWLMWFIAAVFDEITTCYCRAEEASVPEPKFYGSRTNNVFAQEIYSLCQPQTEAKTHQSHVATFPAISAPHALFQCHF